MWWFLERGHWSSSNRSNSSGVFRITGALRCGVSIRDQGLGASW